MRVIFLVIASDDPVHELDLNIQKQTWAATQSQDAEVIWLRGSNSPTFQLEGNTLFVPCPETYKNILRKTILGVKYLVENKDFDILIRTNVSTYFDVRRTLLELRKKRYSDDFVGGYFDLTNGGYFGIEKAFEYISGTGVFLSRGAAELLSQLDPIQYETSPDDVAITHFFSSKELRFIRMLRNNLSSTYLFLPTYFTRTKNSADSSMAGERMRLIYQYFNSPSITKRIHILFSIYRAEYRAFRNQTEGLILYVKRNRVVAQSYLKTRGWQLCQLIFRF
jgi:hypothetical protein